jgi:hypothetical protein
MRGRPTKCPGRLPHGLSGGNRPPYCLSVPEAFPGPRISHRAGKMPDRAMSAAQGDTLAPWVLGEGATTSRQAASRMLRCPGARCETGRRTGGGLDTPALLIPPPTSSLVATGALQAALARRDAGTPPRPGPALAQVAGSRRMGGLHRVAPRRALRPRAAVSRPAAPRPPGHSPPAAVPLQRDRSPHPAPRP